MTAAAGPHPHVGELTFAQQMSCRERDFLSHRSIHTLQGTARIRQLRRGLDVSYASCKVVAIPLVSFPSASGRLNTLWPQPNVEHAPK